MANINTNDRTFLSAQFQRMSDEQCQKIHWASLEVMERTGVRLYEQEAVDLLQKAGAFVSDGNRVRIPSGLVEKAFTTVPRRVVLCDRHGKRVMPLEGYRSFYGPGSDCLHIIDHRTGERRQPVLQDVIEGMTVADALPNIDFVMSMVLPVDVPQLVADRYQMEAMLNYSTKPIIFVTTEFAGCVDAVEMAEVVVGGAEALRQNPFAACYINVTTGLRHNEEALQKLLYLAGKGLPALYIPVGMGGATAPVTLAGCQVIWNVGALVGLATFHHDRALYPQGIGFRRQLHCIELPQHLAHVVLKDLPQRPANVQVNGGAIVLTTQVPDALFEPTYVARQLCSILANLLWNIVHQGVGQRGHAPDDHIVRVEVTLAPRLGVDGNRRVGARQVPFLGNDLGHREVAL